MVVVVVVGGGGLQHRQAASLVKPARLRTAKISGMAASATPPPQLPRPAADAEARPTTLEANICRRRPGRSVGPDGFRVAGARKIRIARDRRNAQEMQSECPCHVRVGRALNRSICGGVAQARLVARKFDSGQGRPWTPRARS